MRPQSIPDELPLFDMPRCAIDPWRWVSHCVFAMVVTIGSMSHAETWADRLGYPPNTKVLLLHVNEMGMCFETNAAVSQALESGPVRSASAMPPCPWFADAAAWSASHPDAEVGLELTVNSEWKNYRWRPVAGDALVASLLDPNRFFWQSPIQIMVNATADDVEQELLAQIAYAKSIGMRPTHLTTHLGALVTRPDLIEVYLKLAQLQWIPAVVVELTPEQLERFRSSGFALPDDLVQLFDAYPLPKLDDLRLLPPAESYAARKEAFLAMVRELPPGLTQIALQPAIESDALKRITPDWQERVWDAQLLADPDVRSTLGGEGIVITDWREVMDRFEGRPQQADKNP